MDGFDAIVLQNISKFRKYLFPFKTKKRRKSNSENRRRMSLGGNTKMTNGSEMAEGKVGGIEMTEGGGGHLEFTKITERIFGGSILDIQRIFYLFLSSYFPLRQF